jgi:ABC-type multidrug transport system fused ATPase/permease subunit
MSETSERPTMSSMGKPTLKAVPDRADVPLVAELPTFKTPNRDLLLKIKKIQNQLIGLAINIHKQYEDHQQHQEQYNYFAHYKVRDTLLMKQTAALVQEREYVDDAINSFMLRSNEHKESNRRAVSNRLTMMFWSFITFTVITCFLVIAFAPSFSGLIIPFIFGSAVISALAILTSYAGNVAAFTIWMIIIFAALYLILSI